MITQLDPQLHKHSAINRFSINKIILSDFALFSIIDNEQQKVVCHLVYDNGEQYCDEMANKMLAGLNGFPVVTPSVIRKGFVQSINGNELWVNTQTDEMVKFFVKDRETQRKLYCKHVKITIEVIDEK